MFYRKQLFLEMESESIFLWGARQTGKSTLLRTLFPLAEYYDLLLNTEYERFLRNPGLLKERVEILPAQSVVIIDEIQRLPILLNEVHWLIENKKIQFILSGSSPRKIIRNETNLLGGRALRYELYPLVFNEIPEFNLLQALNNGLLPRHYLSAKPGRLISSYIGNYLRDEIATEAKIRNLTSFSQFLEKAAFSNGEIVNYSNIASDCGVSVPTVKGYFQILEDTLLGRFIQPYQKKPKRRVVLSPKFYYFDVGIANYLLKRGKIEYGSEAFGSAFEHYICQELVAHSHYSEANYQVYYWRTSSQFEVDFILGENEVAIEVKATDNIQPRHLKGLHAFAEEYTLRRQIIVCNEPYPRKIGDIEILPWKVFLERLWEGDLIK